MLTAEFEANKIARHDESSDSEESEKKSEDEVLLCLIVKGEDKSTDKFEVNSCSSRDNLYENIFKHFLWSYG